MQMKSAALCPALAVVAATAGVAQTEACPSGPAVDGVYISFAEHVVRLELRSDGTLSERETGFDGSYEVEFRTHPLGLILESWDLENGRRDLDTTETVTLTGTPSVLPFAAPGVRWEGTEVSTLMNGSEERFSTSVFVSTETDVFPMGACQYPAHSVMVTRIQIGSVEPETEEHVFIPELGITLYLGIPGGDEYELPTAISTRPPGTGTLSPPTTEAPRPEK